MKSDDIPRKKPLDRIKSGALSRGFSLARMSATLGMKAATHAVGGLFASEEQRGERLKDLLRSQLDVLARELGQLKGSLMKAGQMLSMMGEHVLPPEVNAVLKTLQSQSPPLKWEPIRQSLLRELGAERLALLEIEEEPLASASLGQVHRARLKPGAAAELAKLAPEQSAPREGEWLALKVQYPGVEAAIEGDLKALRSLLAVTQVIPRGVTRFDGIFAEVKQMLQQEVDYTQELSRTEEFRGLLANDPRYVVPHTFAALSSRRVLATSLEEGISPDSEEIRALSLEDRNAIGRAALELYLREIFELGRVQTDPHFGNYRVRLPHQLVLLDFGAVREFDAEFLGKYRRMVRGAFYGDRAALTRAGYELDFLREGDSEKLEEIFVDLCLLFTEPFRQEEPYDWANSDLPQRVAKKAGQMALAFGFRNPPREIVFLDRKMAGLFIFLKVLGVRFESRAIMQKFIDSGEPG